MRIQATFTDNSAKFLAQYDKGAKAGVDGVGRLLLSEMKKAYSNYYTTQRFRNTIFIKQSWKAAPSEKARDGYYTLVGVPRQMVTPKGQKTSVDRGMVALGWEIGHFNEYAKKWLRVPIAVPTATQLVVRMRDTWGSIVKRYLEAT
jgi:hypothetical protein